MSNLATNRRLNLSLRTKLLLVSFTLLVIPWIGYQYVIEMGTFLRQGQEESLSTTVRAVSNLINEHPEAFQRQADVITTAKSAKHIYVRPLKSEIVLDGYARDWEPYLRRFRHFGKNNIIENPGLGQYQRTDFSFIHAMGTWKGDLYAIFKVTDNKVIYRSSKSWRLGRSDHLQIAIQSPDGKFRRYILATAAPGWVNAHIMPDDIDNQIPGKPEIRIEGKWQETSGGGYIIEIRIPLKMIGSKIAFAIADVDNRRTRILKTVIGTAGTRHINELGTLMVPSPELEKLLQGLGKENDLKTWVIDKNRRVIALAGNLNPKSIESKTFLSGFIRTLIFNPPSSGYQDKYSAASVLYGVEITSALNGIPKSTWRKTRDNRAQILSVAHPVRYDGKIIGAVIMQKTKTTILSLQNEAIINLFSVSFLVLVIATSGMLIFATRLSSRVRRLRDDAEQAIGADGRVQGTITGSLAGDEIGDLNRSFSDMLERLGHYNRYLESMASKLSHELRTPIAVVKSSLDNLDRQPLHKDAQPYTDRAREGIDRLNNILTRMSEATRLEQSLQNIEQELFPMEKVVAGCVEGYKLAYPDNHFTLVIEDYDYNMFGVPDLLAQMFDKLISNAIDFCDKETVITIQLSKNEQDVTISIHNQGAELPKEIQSNLFDSMVSARTQPANEVHLGLGLYIVRLIVDFHRGLVRAENTQEPPGVKFTITLPQRFDTKRSGVFAVPKPE